MILVKVQSEYYGGIDLHSKSMTVCIINTEGKVVLRKTIPNDMNDFIRIIASYKHSINFAVEATFNWYWLVDACRAHSINIHLAHAYHLRLIHGSKNKSDKLDAYKIACLLRGGLLPFAHACFPEKRTIRDMLRRRYSLVVQRSTLLAQTKISFFQHGNIEISGQSLKRHIHRQNAIESFADENIRMTTSVNMELATHFDECIRALEKKVLQHAEEHYPEDLNLLLGVPGIGPIIGLTIFYEIDTISRFKTRQRFSSYCRLARPLHTSNGKIVGSGNSKCGNAALKWAFMEILTNASVKSKEIKAVYLHLKEKYPNLKARAILANHFATAVYYMLKHKKPFDIKLFLKAFPGVVSQASAAGGQVADAA